MDFIFRDSKIIKVTQESIKFNPVFLPFYFIKINSKENDILYDTFLIVPFILISNIK